MEYFDADYSEEIEKTVKSLFYFCKRIYKKNLKKFIFLKMLKPEVFSIPRGNLDLEPDVELSEEERRAKEKKMLEIKKMLALQSLQQIGIDDRGGYDSMNGLKNAPNSFNYNDTNFEKEKKAREHVIRLKMNSILPNLKRLSF